MPKARNSKVDEALALYRQGLKLIEISRKLDIPEGTVRRWKCTYKWDAPEETERSQPKNRTLANEEGSLVTRTPPGHPVTRTPRGSASCPSISQRRRWNCCT